MSARRQFVQWDQIDPTEITFTLGVDRSNKAVIISVRRVRNKNVTFIDGLDDWGFSKERMEDLAKEFRKRFSASASVGERQGNNSGKRDLWSIQVQGKYIHQVAEALKDKGITKVQLEAGKGIVTKQDKKAAV